MPRIAREKSKSGIYHIMWRGANRQEIFHDEEDRIKFVDILEKYKRKSKIALFAYCLMGNHVHLLLKEGGEEIAVTTKRIGVSYAMYYNVKYHTTGHLFQDRFRSESIEDAAYLRTVTRYIHQNPLKAGMVRSVHEWKWSSCQAYYDPLPQPHSLVDQGFILRLFSNDWKIAKERFMEFNEIQNNDNCLEFEGVRKRLSDDEARKEIMKVLQNVEMTHVKSLPQADRRAILGKVKKIDGISQRQAARILGVSPNLIFKA